MAIECNKYDQQPNAKGKVSPKFEKKNADRLWGVRRHLIGIGQDEARKGNNDNTLRFWGALADSEADPLFASQNHQAEAEWTGQVCYFAGRYAFDAKQYGRANKYLDIAMKDPNQKAEAMNYKLYAMRSNLKNAADSAACINTLKAMYEQEPSNDIILDALNSMYEGQKNKAAQTALLDAHLAKYPNSFTALAGKGIMAMNDNDAKTAIDWLQKAAAAKPDNAVIFTYIGICYNSMASNTDDVAKRKDLYSKAIEAFDKAKQIDPNKQSVNWGYNRYQAYYALYGEDDARTKAAEADR
jgi:tetratricopeptide (TPR) repeat protein